MKHSHIGFIAAAAFAALTAACGSQETKVIDNFFRAVQARDNQTVTAFSMVLFDEPVKSWKVKTTGEEQRVKAPLSSLAKALKEVDEAAAENKKDEGAYFNAHPLEVDKVKPLVESGAAVPKNLQTTATEWKKFTDADKDLKARAAEAKQAYEREKRLVAMSLGATGAGDSLEGFLVTKTATVEVDTGKEVKVLAIAIRKYDIAPGSKGAKTMSRWLIQSITPQ